MPYIGAGGKEYMSSVLAKASMPGGYTQTTSTSQPDWLSSLVQASQASNAANNQRAQQAMAIYDEIINRYQPGGSFETKSLAELERLKKRSVREQFGQSEQQAISGGMFGVQRPTRAGMGMKWEETVGAPARLSLEDVLMQRLSGAQQNKASFIEGIQDTGPSLSDIFSMAQAGQSSGGQYSAPSSGGSSGGLPSMQEFGANITGGGTGGTGGSVKGTKPVPGAGTSSSGTSAAEQKRLADEEAARKLQAAGNLRPTVTPEETKQATTKSSFAELYGGGTGSTGGSSQRLTINTPEGALLIESAPGDTSLAKWGYGGYRVVKKL